MVTERALVGVIMGSQSDWDTMKNAAETLTALAIPHEVKVCLLYTSDAADESSRG